MTTIALINQSTVIADRDADAIAAALKNQVQNEWQVAWGSTADVLFVPQGATPPSGSWWLVFLDNSDMAGALGYHDLTSEGLPLGKVFAATDHQYGLAPSVTASHELLEMLGDPDVSRCVQDGSRLWSLEVADAVEADALGYTIDGVLVSDFVTPAYFSRAIPGPWDFKGHLTGPLTLAPGGYMSYLDFATPQGWQQVFAEVGRGDRQADYHARPKVGSRRERRRTPRDQWVQSTAHA
jgi:hypothetical protein